jgi:hypothetical protein
MAQQIPLTFSEVLNLPSLGVSANAIKFGVRTRANNDLSARAAPP